MIKPTEKKRVAVIGLGYVGLPLLLRFSEAGIDALGVDIDPKKLELLSTGTSYLTDITNERVGAAVQGDSPPAFTDDFSELSSCSAVIVCVPTPLGEGLTPDLSYVLETARGIGAHLQPSMLVILESTTYPGTTEGPFREILEEMSGLKAGTDFSLAYSPEREDPGGWTQSNGQPPKVVGGMTQDCLQAALSTYAPVVTELVSVSSCAVAEGSKLLENIYRAVNIALINELKIIYGALDIDIWEVIEAAKTKPFGFMPFYPGPGLGGHCIPIDPFYLSWLASQHGESARFIELAGEINRGMPTYVLSQTEKALAERGIELKESRLLVLGVAYKPDVNDTRESPGLTIIDLLHKAGSQVDFSDHFVPQIPNTRSYPHLAGKASVELSELPRGSYDAIIIVTYHSQTDLSLIPLIAPIIIDTRNAMHEIEVPTACKVIKA